MECKLKNRNELIANYLIGELTEDETRSFEEHYFQCETCFKELKSAEAALNIIEEEGPKILSAKKSPNRIFDKLLFPNLSAPMRWGIAFTTVAAAVLIFLVIVVSQNDKKVINDKIISEEKKPLTGEDTASEIHEQPEQDKNIFAELTGPTFEPNAYMEEWITESTRSGSEIIDTVLSPQLRDKFYDSEINFKWRMTNKAAASLIIMNNREKEILTTAPDTLQFPLLTAKAKSEIIKESGLYYWRIEDESEVLYVGKFYFVKKGTMQ